MVERPDYFRTLLEPLEDRTLLSAVGWTIDSSQSSLTLTVPDQNVAVSIGGSPVPGGVGFHLGNQSQTGDASQAWTVGNTAAMSGTLATDYVDGTSVQFLTNQSSMAGVVNPSVNSYPNLGTASPNPGYGNPGSGTEFYPSFYSNYIFDGGNRTDGKGTPSTNHSPAANGFQSLLTAPAVFGARTHATYVFGFYSADVSYLSIPSTSYDESSGLLSINGSGNFAANSIVHSTSGSGGLYGLSVPVSGQIPDYVTNFASSLSGTNTAPTGSVTAPDPVHQPLLRKLTVPYSVNLSVFVPFGDGGTVTGTLTGQLVATATLAPPTVDLNGSDPGTGFTNVWSPTAPPVNVAGALTQAPANARIVADTPNLAATNAVTVGLATAHAGDVLAANTTGTSITQSFAGGTLTLSGSDTLANYEKVLQTVTYNNTSGGPGVSTVTVKVLATDSLGLTSAEVDSTINIVLRPVVSLAVVGGPNYTGNWFNSGPVPIENMAQANVTDANSTTLSSMTIALQTFHLGDVLQVPILASNSAISAVYLAGTLTLTGTATLAQYSQELRLVNYNYINSAGGPGAAPVKATVVANDGTNSSAPVTATINLSVASGEVLGNRLFYNNSKYDVNNAAINASDDAAIASDKVGFDGTGVATFVNVSSATRGITGVMVDLNAAIGTHANITSGDITFKVAPAGFVAGSYNQLSTWTAFTSETAISVRMNAGTGGSDRVEITFANNAIKNTWLEVDLLADDNTGLSNGDDVFYFGNAAGDSGLGDTAALAKVDINDANPPNVNVLGLTTQVFQILDYTKDGKVDVNDANAAAAGLFTLHYIANPDTGPFASDGGGGAAAPAAVATASAAPVPVASTASVRSDTAVFSGLSLLNRLPTNPPTWLAGRLQGIVSSQPVATLLQSLTHQNSTQSNQVLQTLDQIAARFNLHDDVLNLHDDALILHDDVLDGLLADLRLE
jgi:hypothetical protein